MEEKTCFKCGTTLPLSGFYKHSGMKDGHLNKCKTCTKTDTYSWRDKKPNYRKEEYQRSKQFKNRKYGVKYPNPKWTEEIKIASQRATACKYAHKRRLLKEQVTPLWYDKSEVDYIYKLAAEKGLAVDHIVPLNHAEVCGLHTGDNLRCIPKRLNEIKTNAYWPDMWDEQKAKNILSKHIPIAGF